MDVSIPVVSVLIVLLMDAVQWSGAAASTANVGHWTDWSGWSGCSISCGSGTMKRQRKWVPPPGQPPMNFTMTDHSGCTEAACPVDGQWSMWSKWSECTEPCGAGTTTRLRSCTQPTNGGLNCEGENFEEEVCNKVPCPPLPPHFNLSQCSSNHFMCTSGQMCVHSNEACDNVVQCHDGSDEKDCSTSGGNVGYSFVKGSGSTITASLSLTTSLLVVIRGSLIG